MKLKDLLIASIFLLGPVLVSAQNEADFYTPKNGGVTKNLKNNYGVDNNFATNDSQKLQNAINDVSNAGGGRIIIPAGKYSFSNVQLKSNVRIEIDKGATLRPWNITSGNYTMFTLGGNTRVKNVSITGTGGRFTVDLKYVSNENIMVFSCNNVYNFKLANFNILDKHTVFQSISFAHKTVNGKHYVPSKGLIKNATATKCHYGYGLVQVQAGNNLLFKNLDGTGGVTLRLESGWTVMNLIPEPHTPKINKVYGRKIKCSYGQGALMMEPHAINQGFVDVRDITGIGVEFAAKIGKGSNHKATHLTPGTFASNSIISNVKATYKDNAHVRAHYLPFIPCNLRSKIKGNTPSGEAKYAPAVAAVGYFANGLHWGRGPNDPGSYTVKISDVKAWGFQSSVPNIVTSDYCDYEDCAIQVWIHNDAKNTIGNCSEGTKSSTNRASLNSTNEETNIVRLYPNPVNDILNINTGTDISSNAKVSIINSYGEVVMNVILKTENTTINTNQLSSGFYFARVVNGNNIITSKIIKQ